MDPKTEILLKEYDNRREEISWHSQRFHKQTNLSYLYVSIIFAIFGIITSNANIFLIFNTASIDIFKLLLLIIAAMIGFYLYSSTLDSWFMLILNGIRVGVIEKKINSIEHEELLVWDNKIANYYLGPGFNRAGIWIKTPIIVTIWVLIFFVSTNILLCFLSYFIVPKYFCYYSWCVISLTIFHILQLYSLNDVGFKHMLTFITQVSDNNKISLAEFKSLRLNFFTVWFISFIIGFLPMALLSISSNTFFINDDYPFSFIRNMSVMIGDLLFLPIFNFYFYKLLITNIGEIKKYRLLPIIIPIIVAAISTFIQYLIHSEWTKDNYLGFMDSTIGELSNAGWWHFIYASFETSIIILFLILLYISRDNKTSLAIGAKGLLFFFIYTLIGIADLIINVSITHKTLEFSWTLISIQSYIIIRIVLVGIIYLLLKKRLIILSV